MNPEEDKGTMTVPEGGALLGISRTTAYTVAKKTGALAGVPVLRVGRQLRIPRAPFLRALGIRNEREEDHAEFGTGDV